MDQPEKNFVGYSLFSWKKKIQALSLSADSLDHLGSPFTFNKIPVFL